MKCIQTVVDGGRPNEMFGNEGLLNSDKSLTLSFRSTLLVNDLYCGSTS